MTFSCNIIASLLVACLGYVPDTSKKVPLPQRCVTMLEKIGQREKAEDCAVEHSVTYEIIKRKKRRR